MTEPTPAADTPAALLEQAAELIRQAHRITVQKSGKGWTDVADAHEVVYAITGVPSYLADILRHCSLRLDRKARKAAPPHYATIADFYAAEAVAAGQTMSRMVEGFQTALHQYVLLTMPEEPSTESA